ncbi:MAG: class I SAM-dependent methyltransferase [Magnetococcales bacterium]|nr:class I SAM-dependent methyltransferase [Magnetococcales bacterium]
MEIKKKIRESPYFGRVYQVIYNEYYALKRISVKRMFRLLRPGRIIKWAFSRTKTIDYLYGVDTGGFIRPEELGVARENLKDALQYQRCNEELLVSFLELENLPVQGRVLVDLGSGKGLVLMYAARKKFSRIIGIEFSEKLHRISLNNIIKFKSLCSDIQCSDVDSVLGDASEYDFPDDPIIIFMYNPFGANVMRHVLCNMEARIQRSQAPLMVVYMEHRQKDVLDQSPFLKNVTKDFFSQGRHQALEKHFAIWEGRSASLD